MRYPVGTRTTLQEAYAAAVYASKLTKMRYRVYIGIPVRGRKYAYLPAQFPPPEPFTHATEL